MDKAPEDKGEKLEKPKPDDENGKKKKVDEVRTPAPASVLVKAPADVMIRVNGQRISRRATEETFLTPALRPGQAYAYQFQAEVTRNGERVTRSRQVIVRTGRRSVVDFSDLASASVASAR
jgi:uncharacterized protein (TIGR03000 family)